MFDLKDKEGVWLKGNLHTHTSASDGKLSPEDAIRLYKQNGYDFIALTDHFNFCRGGTFEGVTVLSGAEYNFGVNTLTAIYHIVGIGMEKNPEIIGNSQIPALLGASEAIKKIHEAGGIAVLAHPAWSLNTPKQIHDVGDFDLTEIYNTVSGEPYNMRAESGQVLDAYTMNYGKLPPLTAVDDVHYYTVDCCRSFIRLKALSNSRDDIMAALKRGDFYASQGPEFYNIHKEGGSVTVSFSEAHKLNVFTDNYAPEQMYIYNSAGEYVFDNEKVNASYLRFKITDKCGKSAWTSYIYF